MAAKVVHVAVGVIFNNDGNILIARRADDAHQGGLWEFPGGKVDSGETVYQALHRELHEELNIRIEQTEPLIQIRHDYTDKSVLLDVHKVLTFSGEARGNEGQPIRWIHPRELVNYSFPAANKPIITALHLPDTMLVTGDFDSPADFSRRLTLALQSGIRLVQLRCFGLPESDFHTLVNSAKNLCDQYQAILVCNTSLGVFAQVNTGGLHLNRHEIKKYESRPVSDAVLLGASCHDLDEIKQARRIGADYICLSPVAQTDSHPGANGIGWEKFAELTVLAGVPVFALGGMTTADIKTAKFHGGQGIAAIRCFWPD